MLGFCGLLAVALAMGVTSLLAFRQQAFGRVVAWCGILCAAGIVAANVLLLGGLAIPAVLLWTIATSAGLARSLR